MPSYGHSGRVYLPDWDCYVQVHLQAIIGYQLELTQKPHQARRSIEIYCSLEEQPKSLKRLAKDAIIEAHLSPQSYVSQIFLVEKKEGRQRPVINLKDLNRFVKMEGGRWKAFTCCDPSQQTGWWSWTWRMHTSRSQYIRSTKVSNRGENLPVFMPPFGLTSATREFTKIMKPGVGLLR